VPYKVTPCCKQLPLNMNSSKHNEVTVNLHYPSKGQLHHSTASPSFWLPVGVE